MVITDEVNRFWSSILYLKCRQTNILKIILYSNYLNLSCLKFFKVILSFQKLVDKNLLIYVFTKNLSIGKVTSILLNV